MNKIYTDDGLKENVKNMILKCMSKMLLFTDKNHELIPIFFFF